MIMHETKVCVLYNIIFSVYVTTLLCGYFDLTLLWFIQLQDSILLHHVSCYIFT